MEIFAEGKALQFRGFGKNHGFVKMPEAAGFSGNIANDPDLTFIARMRFLGRFFLKKRKKKKKTFLIPLIVGPAPSPIPV